MGFPMAGNIRKRMPPSATLHIFDVSESASQNFVRKFGSWGKVEIARSPKEVAEKCRTVISMVPSGKEARNIYLDIEQGIIAARKDAERLLLESSTIEVSTAQEICREIGNAGNGFYVDAPVSGGVAAAEAAALSFFCGLSGHKGSNPFNHRAWDTICYMGASERVTFCGNIGAGLVCKITNNYICLSNVVAAAEGMAFGIKHGVDKVTLYNCIRGSTGDSWVINNIPPSPGVIPRSPSSNGFRPTFTPGLCVKDISLGIQAAHETGIEASMGETALKIFKKTHEDPRTTVSSPWIFSGSVAHCRC